MSVNSRSPYCRFILFLACGGYLTYLPYRIVPFSKWKGSGLLGSLIGLGLLLVFPERGIVLWAATVGLFVLSIWISHRAEMILASHDDPRIVIDEVIGMWIAGLYLPRTIWALAGAFVLFRFFDVWKGPWGRRLALLPGGWGIVADDVMAGIIANLCFRLIHIVF